MTASIEIDISKVGVSEKDIEDWLWENPRAVGVRKWIGRQASVPSGVLDLIGLGAEIWGEIRVVEVKNVQLSSAHLAQVTRYSHDIWTILLERDNLTHVSKALIGKGPINNQFLFEAKASEVDLYTFEVKLDLSIGGKWNWNDDFEKELDQKYKDLANGEIGESLVATIQADLAEERSVSDAEDIVEKAFDQEQDE